MSIEAGSANHGVRHSKHADSHKNGKGPQATADAGRGVDFMAVLAGMGAADDAALVGVDLGCVADGGALAPLVDPLATPTATDIAVGVPVNLPVEPKTVVQSNVTAVPLNADSVLGQSPKKAGLELSVVTAPTVATMPAAAPSPEPQVPMGVTPTPVAEIMDALENAVVPMVSAESASTEPAVAAVTVAHESRLATVSSLAVSDQPKPLFQGKNAKSHKAFAVEDSPVYSKEPALTSTVGKPGLGENRLQNLVFRQIEAQAAAAPTVAATVPEFNGLLRESNRIRLADRQFNLEAMAMPLAPTPNPLGVSATEQAIPLEAVVAEKVAYWVSNDVQNAELKLDGLGEQPVEVSIRVQGNEAHVAFRTDELQARSALEQAGTTLKDLLQREGLTLAGVSVGTTGTGDGQRDSDRKGRAPVRHGSVEMASSPDVSRARPSGLSVGRSLDLFV